jgi:hypothetical protein
MLFKAAEVGNVRTVGRAISALVAAHGCVQNNGSSWANIRDINGVTPLVVALKNADETSRLAVCAYLLNHGADLFLKDNRGVSVLSAFAGQPAVVKQAVSDHVAALYQRNGATRKQYLTTATTLFGAVIADAIRFPPRNCRDPQINLNRPAPKNYLLLPSIAADATTLSPPPARPAPSPVAVVVKRRRVLSGPSAS